jgi:succinate dehydrogenase / fumarate reductase membrane anchor subunit
MVNRIVTGAHYGLRDWLAQRITGVMMAIYTVILLAFFFSQPPVTFESWKALFAHGWMRIATLLFAASLAWHAWVGMRDILMDYVKPTSLRLSMEIGTLVVIAVYVAWTIQILWR